MVRRTPVPVKQRRTRRLPVSEQRGTLQARPLQMPPPVGGWNAKDSLANMKPTEAVSMVNWFPRQSDVITRPGFSSHCDTTESGAGVRQLIPFEYSTHSKLLACVNDAIYDVTTATPSSLATSLAGVDFSFDYLGGYVLMANGADVVKSYNGTAIANPAFTGVTLSELNHVSVYGGRAYFTQANTQTMWYGGVGAVAGALLSFDFGTVAPVRGNLLFTTSLKGDGGEGGANDLFCAVFEGGDVLTYAGTNPSDAANFNKVGHYHIGRPLGRFAYTKADDDVYVLTNRGYEKLGEISKFGDSAPEKMLLSAKIQLAVSDDIASVGESADWRVMVYPKGQSLIVTVPKTGTAREYHIRNINTGSWCKYTDFIAYSWATLAGVCYFGGDAGVVYAFDDGSVTDAGETIRSDCQQAWSSMGASARVKKVTLIQPYLNSGTKPSTSINVGSDFDLIVLAPFDNAETSNQAVWDTSVWDTAIWTTDDQTFLKWYSRNAIGEKIGLRLALDTSTSRVRWNQTTMLVTTGGLI